ncbi:hypothetical protein ACVIDN_006639 [Rhizobium brockwellii]
MSHSESLQAREKIAPSKSGIKHWIDQGVFDRIFEAVAADPDMEWLSIDATVIRAQAQAAGGRRKRGDRKPRLSAAPVADLAAKSML